MQPEPQQDDAKPGVALILGDGSQLLPSGRVIPAGAKLTEPNVAQVATEIRSGREAVRVLERMHRKLGDLPELPVKMNPIAAIITYTAIGLSDEDIAVSLGASPTQIKTIKDSEAYKSIEAMFDQTVFEDERRNAKHIIAKATTRAAQTMVSLIDSEREDIAAVASRDVLKLSGITTEEENTRRQGALRIVVTRKGEREEELKVEINNA